MGEGGGGRQKPGNKKLRSCDLHKSLEDII